MIRQSAAKTRHSIGRRRQRGHMGSHQMTRRRDRSRESCGGSGYERDRWATKIETVSRTDPGVSAQRGDGGSEVGARLALEPFREVRSLVDREALEEAVEHLAASRPVELVGHDRVL